jgi:hypothetical protein
MLCVIQVKSKMQKRNESFVMNCIFVGKQIGQFIVIVYLQCYNLNGSVSKRIQNKGKGLR